MNEYPSTIDELDERLIAISKENIWQRLDGLLQVAVRIPWTEESKGIVFCDLHRGIVDKVDLFAKNELLLKKIQTHYTDQGYKTIINGDADELWINDSLAEIEKFHGQLIFDYRTSGNHDMELGYPEAIILDSPKPILIHHGYGGDGINDQNWKMGRWIVRHLARELEEAGIINLASASEDPERHDLVAQALEEWAFDRKHILLAGHIHTERVAPPFYWNGGYCIGQGIDALLIEGNDVQFKHFDG